ncbi:hypothetical protein Tco_1476907 [Tanacetum coccineum]
MSQPANDDFSQHLSDDEESNHEDASDTGNAPKQQQQVIPQTTAISNIKLPILKKEEYDIWAMEMEHYLEYIDNEVWKVIQNGNSKKRISTGKDGIVRVLSPVTAAEIQAVEKERKAKNILLMAIPKEHMRRFHGMDDAKEIWEAIRTRFGGNANSKKMQKAVFKQQFEAFKISNSEGLEKGYDRFQQLLSQLEAHGAEVSTEISNISFSDLCPQHVLALLPTSSNQWFLKKKSLLGFAVERFYVMRKENELFCFFSVSKEDSIGKPLYSRFYYKTNDFKKGVPHPLSGDYTPKPQEEIDDSLYVYGKKGPQKPEISDSGDNSSEHSSCQSNDSEGSCGNTSEHSFETESESLSVPNEMSKSRKNWNDMMERELGEGYSFTKKKCFVCGSLSHLIKDCDYYEKKMAREAEVKRVVNTGNGVTKPVWTNANRINHSNKFVPRSVQLNAGRPKFNSVRPNINTDLRTARRPFAKTTAQMSHSNAVMGSWGSAVKTSASYNWRNSRPNFHYNSGPTFNRTVNAKGPQGRPKPAKAWGQKDGNKDQLEDFEEFNRGSVTFGGSKGYISGKGRIRVGNLDFDSVSFVKELGHFNLFSISQICDKQHKVLFTETECLVVSSDFKMPDENQILLKVPRHHNMYSFDMKTPTPAKGFACLIAKATSDESKLWHRRNTEGKAESRKSSTNSKKEEILTKLQQEKKAFSTDTSEDNPKII